MALIEEIIYLNDIKIVKEISTYSDDPYYREDHYNKDNFHFYHKMSNTVCKVFWFKSPYWTKTIDYDPNREIRLIDIDGSESGIFVKDKCQFKITRKNYKKSYDTNYYNADLVSMIYDIK